MITVKMSAYDKNAKIWKFIKEWQSKDLKSAENVFHMFEQAFNAADGTRLAADFYKDGEWICEM